MIKVRKQANNTDEHPQAKCAVVSDSGHLLLYIDGPRFESPLAGYAPGVWLSFRQVVAEASEQAASALAAVE